MSEFTNIDTDNPTQSDVEQLLTYVHKNGVNRTKSLNRLHTIAQDQPELVETGVIAEHIRRSTQAQVRKRLYNVARVLVSSVDGKPESASALFGVIQDDLTYPNTGDDDITQGDLMMMRGYIFDILYSAADNGVKIPPQVLEELYSSAIEYPAMSSAERTVNILGSIIDNDLETAERATEVLIELSTVPESHEDAVRFKKYATATLAGLLDEGGIPNPCDTGRIREIIEQNREILEGEEQSSDKGLLDRLL